MNIDKLEKVGPWFLTFDWIPPKTRKKSNAVLQVRFN